MYRRTKGKVKLSGSWIVPDRPYSIEADREERLPFRVRLAETAQDLQKAVDIRATAYTRHLPRLGSTLWTAEAEDHRRDVLLLIAERKLDGQAVGTIRLHPNLDGHLPLQSETELPGLYRGKRLLEYTRLGVQNGSSGTMVMAALGKAAFEISHACGFEYGLAVARRSMVELFRTMCYEVVVAAKPMSYSRGVPLAIVGIPILEVDARLRARKSAYYDFMARSSHPDIDLDYGRVFETFGTS